MGVHLFRGRFTHPRIGGPPRSISPRKGGVGVHHCYRTSRLGGGGGGVNGKGVHLSCNTGLVPYIYTSHTKPR